MLKMQLQPQLIRAGAGTGKTSALIEEVHRLFKEFRKTENRDPRLIVCTFTRKASQELKERLFKEALKDIEKEFGSKSANLKQKGNLYQNGKASVEKSSSLFLSYVQSPSLYISTIDGILNLFLRRYGHRFDLSPDFQLSSSSANGALFDSMAPSFLFEEALSLLKKLPYPYLKKLFLFYFNCCLKYGKVSFCNRKDFENFWKERESFLKVVESLSRKKKEADFISDSLLIDKKSSLKNLFSQGQGLEDIKDFFKEEESFQADYYISLFEEFKDQAERFFPLFLEKKKNSGLLDMEDLFLFSLALLRESPQTAKDFSREWDYWLIDEYQDTSWMQEQIIQKITGFENVFCVGDPGQSIYLFRSADPKVFQRREEALKGKVKRRDINYRSSPELIHFYNDFFPEQSGFMKCHPSGNSPRSEDTPSGDSPQNAETPSIYFLTYEKKSKEKLSMETLKALSVYIQKLKGKGYSYSDIAVLSSKNEDLANIAASLRSRGFPLSLSSSKSFAQKRLIRDSLFLLKFLINPFDNTNFKALLRTPYFRLSDQELADSSYEHYKLTEEQKQVSFWSVVQKRFSERCCIKSLNLYLEEKKTNGLVKALEKALLDSGLMECSYLQDPTGSSEANLWKFLYLLNKESSSPLELFYSLHEEKEEGFDAVEAPSEGMEEALKLMTIHKSKGLEFRHVIIMDSSMSISALRTTGDKKDSVIYNEERQQMDFAVPIGGRDKKQVKSYTHKLYNKQKALDSLEEKNRVFYVAMTRAEESLAVFIPNIPPEKNSWLKGVSFFERLCVKSEESKQNLLEKKFDPKNAKRIQLWRLNEGFYKTGFYSFRVQSVDSLCQGLDLDSKKLLASKQKQEKKSPALTGGEKYFESLSLEKPLSSKHFIDEREDRSPVHKDFQLVKEKNILNKTYLGNHLHFFLKKLAFQPLKQVQSLVGSAVLLEKEKKQIQEALVYIYKLKKPPMKLFLEKGFPEWPFKLKKEGLLVQGQVDLWGWDDKDIHIFDYKSSESQLHQTKRQLIFYSWVLNEFYQPNRICFHAVYPFQKKIISSLYGETEKSLFDRWMKSR